MPTRKKTNRVRARIVRVPAARFAKHEPLMIKLLQQAIDEGRTFRCHADGEHVEFEVGPRITPKMIADVILAGGNLKGSKP